jgi:hypothetical protein
MSAPALATVRANEGSYSVVTLGLSLDQTGWLRLAAPEVGTFSLGARDHNRHDAASVPGYQIGDEVPDDVVGASSLLGDYPASQGAC